MLTIDKVQGTITELPVIIDGKLLLVPTNSEIGRLALQVWVAESNVNQLTKQHQRLEAELQQLQQTIDASIDNLDPDR